MASSQSRFDDQRYRNWLTGTLSLLYVKEGIETIIDTEAVRFHSSIAQHIRGPGIPPLICFSCTPKCMKKDFRHQVWKMSCGLCNPWLQQIVQNHINYPFPNLNSENTNPVLWPTCPYEVFKAYMPFGCKNDKSAKDGDVQGIFSLIKKCHHFTTCGRIGEVLLIDELLTFRNSLFHSGSFLVDDADLQAAQQTMLKFLDGMNSLSIQEQHSVLQAVNKITELQTDTLDLSLYKYKKLEIRALKQKQIALDSDQKHLKVELKTTVDDVNTIRKDLELSNLELAEVDSAMQSLQKGVTNAECDVQTLQKDIEKTDCVVQTLQKDIEKTDCVVQTIRKDIENNDCVVQTLQKDIEKNACVVQTLRQETDSDVRTLKKDATKTNSEVQILQKVVDKTESYVYTLQKDVARTDSDVHILQKNVSNTDADVHTVQKDVANVHSDVKTLEDDVASVSIKTSEINSDLRKLTEKTTELEQSLKKLQDMEYNFHFFLNANHLVLDIPRLSTAIESHSQRLQNLETQLQPGNEDKEVTAMDITELQDFLKKYYEKMCLKIPNPVVSEELRLDCLYVDPDINILRETTDPGRGLKNVNDLSTTDRVSQCRQLFYTEIYKCKQIYITGDAGIGKSIYCKHLVDLWCNADQEPTHEDFVYSEHYSDPEQSDSWDSDSDREHSASSGSDMEGYCFSKTRKRRTKKRMKKQTRRTEPLLCKEIERENEVDFKRLDELRVDVDNDENPRLDNNRINGVEERQIMSKFTLLFYVTLRESPDKYHVADMIDYQILEQDEKKLHPKASVLLRKVPCLVIIDGLDEWVCPMDAKVPPLVKPGIPGRDLLNTSNVFLTTTRSWKFDVLQLTSSEVDKHVELVGFNRNTSENLCYKMFDLLGTVNAQRVVARFKTELQRKGLVHLMNIPAILTQLICLWVDNQDLGQSQVQLYCSMLEMLLKRAVKNLPKQTCTSIPETAPREMLLPQCFSFHKHCQEYQHLLASLCKLAFESLFVQKDHSLVFESNQMKIFGVDQKAIEMCLKSGVMSQSKVLGKWSMSKKTFSFVHKNVQEFLAAIFMTNCEKAERISSDVKRACTTVETMLEMSQVFMFVSSLKPDLARQLLTDLTADVVLKDSDLQQFRHTLRDVFERPSIAKTIQNCIIESVVEARSNGQFDFSLPLEDFVIDKHTISACLESILASNKAVAKSVNIRTYKMNDEVVNRILWQIQETTCLQKLYLNDHGHVITNLEPLCQTLDNNTNTLTCLALKYMTLNAESCVALCGTLTHVTTLDLYYVRMTHEQIEKLLSSVSDARTIKELQIWWLNCTDHNGMCRPSINVSALTQLRSLYLGYMDVKRLPMIDCLTILKLWYVTIQQRELRRCIYKLSAIAHTLTVHVDNATVSNIKDDVDLNIDDDLDLFVNHADLEKSTNIVVTKYCNNDDFTRSVHFQTKQQHKTPILPKLVCSNLPHFYLLFDDKFF